MQNKILEVMADQVLAKIDLHLHDIPLYTITVDETTDASNQEQVVICIRWVNKLLEVSKDFIAME